MLDGILSVSEASELFIDGKAVSILYMNGQEIWPLGPAKRDGPGQRAWWKHLQVYKGATLCADLYPAMLDGVVGMWDKVRETLIHPTDGVWLSGPALT